MNQISYLNQRATKSDPVPKKRYRNYGDYLHRSAEKPAFSTYDESNIEFHIHHGFSDQLITGERTATIGVVVVAKSERPVPIRGTGKIVMILTNAALREINADVSDRTVSLFIILKPDEPTDLTFDAVLPMDWEFFLERQPVTSLELFYYDVNELKPGKYESNVFVINKSFLGLH